MFTERPKNLGIIFVGNHPGPEKQAVENGDTVILKLEGESVLIKDVQRSNGGFRGIIYGFEPSFAQQYKGLAVEQAVEFEERHIVSCASA